MTNPTEHKAHEISDKNILFAKTLAATLDKSVVEFDELSQHRIKNARVRALAQKEKPVARKWIAMSLAASIAILVMAPFVWQQHVGQAGIDQDMDVIAQEIPLDNQEMDDIEMLMAMEDVDV